MTPVTPAIFLDRDGVIVENVESYVQSWRDIVFLPSAFTALKKLSASDYKIILITNQSAVGRGIITLEQARAINQKVVAVIEAAGGRIDSVYMCPHAPGEHCICRKPLPGLILQAGFEHRLDLAHSFTIGDACTDIQAGQAAGISNNILVKTGRGSTQLQLPLAATLPGFWVYDDLEGAVMDILSGCLEKGRNTRA
jgi:D-glycero-D-manno-heptose 1,7-bisphosphate phosphatase